MSTHAVKKIKNNNYYYLLPVFRFIFIIYAAKESYSMTKNFAFPYIEKNIQLLKFQTLLLPLGYFASVTSIASALEK